MLSFDFLVAKMTVWPESGMRKDADEFWSATSGTRCEKTHKNASSTRSSSWKSGNQDEMVCSEMVEPWVSFPKQDSAFLRNWKSRQRVGEGGPGFPRLAEAGEKGLCKVFALCEKRVLRCMKQGVAADHLCTVDGSSTPSTMVCLS